MVLLFKSDSTDAYIDGYLVAIGSITRLVLCVVKIIRILFTLEPKIEQAWSV